MRPSSQQTILLTESPGVAIIRRALWGVLIFVALFLLLSIFIKVDEVTRVRGEVAAIGNAHNIQVADGGYVDEVLVEEGQKVKAGDVIAHFEPTGPRAELATAASARAVLQATQMRLEAFLANKPLDLSKLAADYPDIASEQIREMDAAIKLQVTTEEALRQQVAAAKAEVAVNEKEIPIAESQLKSAQAALAQMEIAEKSGVLPRAEYNQRLQEATNSSRDLAAFTGKRATLRARLTEAEAELAQVGDKARAEARGQLAEASAKLSAADDQFSNLQKRADRTALLAPVDGYVTALPASRRGAVMQPGGIVAAIVPLTSKYVLKVRIPLKDIGAVHADQPARIKIDSLDHHRYGTLPGRVLEVSPTPVKPREGTPFHEGRIALERSQLEADGRSTPVSAGMTGEADVVTGKTSVPQYLWGPIFRDDTTGKSFTERESQP
ncbi:MAG: HlyD family type I secretion periplasmic adaptor subunit [Chthoniobacterales bacterium]|nr:HlyD family type I secretion periplasmic adaptor subunit [Chthoniobacterales bacterium]